MKIKALDKGKFLVKYRRRWYQVQGKTWTPVDYLIVETTREYFIATAEAGQGTVDEAEAVDVIDHAIESLKKAGKHV